MLTQKRSQELKRRLKNDIYRSASHILVCISISQQQKALFRAMSLWRTAVFADREEEYIHKTRQNSEQFHILKQQYAKFAKTYDMLNSKYKSVMSKVITPSKKHKDVLILLYFIIRQEEREVCSEIL